jgi:seryl-tRNA synthetase
MNNKLWSSTDGLVTLSPSMLDLKSRIDACFILIAEKFQADAMIFPVMLPVRDLDQLDYFINFPHLPLAVSLTKGADLDVARKAADTSWDSLAPEVLQEACHVLPPAACYAVYTNFKDTEVGELKTITTISNCFRNETEYVGLKRLKSFTMREVVMLGSMESVTKQLNELRKQICLLAQALDLPVETENATDPFFDPNSNRAKIQKLFPVKQELVFRDGTAISSANFHRNFFGERFNFTANGEVAFTSCIGMGLERWLHALLDVYKDDVNAAVHAVNSYLEQHR